MKCRSDFHYVPQEESLQVDAMPKHQLHQLEASVKSWMFDRLRNRRI